MSLPGLTIAPQPFIHWSGGKGQLLNVLNSAAPASSRLATNGRYFEPFLGGGAFFFSRSPRVATVSDINPELVNSYIMVRDKPDEVVAALRSKVNSEKEYYRIRSLDPGDLSDVDRAARFIYITKTCFNGNYRENKSGKVNIPYGKHPERDFFKEDQIRSVSSYLNQNIIDIRNCGYQYVLDEAKPGDFVYFDPPYAPMSKTANFTSYSKEGFGAKDQVELSKAFSTLDRKGVKVMLSNSNTEVIRDLYSDFRIQTVSAHRKVSGRVGGGSAPIEVLVTNY